MEPNVTLGYFVTCVNQCFVASVQISVHERACLIRHRVGLPMRPPSEGCRRANGGATQIGAIGAIGRGVEVVFAGREGG